MLGLRELAMVAAVVLVLYGRSGVLRSQRFQSILPWIAPVRRKPARPATGGGRRSDGLGPASASASSPRFATATAARPRAFRLEGNRLFWFLTILAATAVATTIISRALILQGASPVPHP
jgi:hypothetical protein